MGRVADLEVKRDKTKGLWYVSVPPKMSDTGKRKRIYSQTKSEAERRSKSLRKVRKECAEMAQKAPPSLLEDAVELDGLAKIMGFSGLREAFLSFSSEFEKKNRSISFRGLLDAYEAQHAEKWSASYIARRWKPFLKKVEDITEEAIAILDADFWKAWLESWQKESKPAPVTYNQFVRMLRAVFEVEEAKEIFERNPLSSIGSKSVEQKEVCVAEPEQVRELLNWCWEHDRDLVPYFALGFFSGMRPDAELEPFRFEKINFEERLLDCVTTKTKRKPRRQIPIKDSLFEWLMPFQDRAGSILPNGFKNRYRRARIAVSIEWGHDIMRHTYGSMYEAAHRSEPGCREDIVYNMGHTSYSTYETHYRNGKITPKQAASFWAIYPKAR